MLHLVYLFLQFSEKKPQTSSDLPFFFQFFMEIITGQQSCLHRFSPCIWEGPILRINKRFFCGFYNLYCHSYASHLPVILQGVWYVRVRRIFYMTAKLRSDVFKLLHKICSAPNFKWMQIVWNAVHFVHCYKQYFKQC